MPMLVDVAVDDVDSQCDISENYKDVSDNKHSTFIKISEQVHSNYDRPLRTSDQLYSIP